MDVTGHKWLLEAAKTVQGLFVKEISSNFYFHNLEHTQSVVNASNIIAQSIPLNESDHLALLLAAWFHDTGYRNGTATDHEMVSQQTALAFMKSQGVDDVTQQKVLDCIAATRVPQQPHTLIEKIICDADLFHLGTKEFTKKAKLLRQELNLVSGNHISKESWLNRNIHFLESHQYFTEYGQQILEPQKIIHLQQLKEKWGPSQNDTEANQNADLPANTYSTISNGTVLTDKKRRKFSADELSRGVETMFRTTSANHFRLSEMADSKAHLLIQVNAIILSILISVLYDKLERYPHLMLPTLIISLVAVITIILSILATRPSVSEGVFSKEDVTNKKVNLLFFGNFHHMSLEEYDWAMKELMSDNEYLYTTMTKDIYFLGLVLARKYKYIHIAYTIFMYGIVLSVAAFILAASFPDAFSF